MCASFARIRGRAAWPHSCYDEITPACSQTILEGLPDGRMEVFEHSAHVAHLEEGERFADVVERFLREVEARP